MNVADSRNIHIYHWFNTSLRHTAIATKLNRFWLEISKMNHQFLHWFITFIAYSADDLDIIWKYCIITTRQRSCGKVMFSVVCVCLLAMMPLVSHRSHGTYLPLALLPRWDPPNLTSLQTWSHLFNLVEQLKSRVRLKRLHVWMVEQDWENICHWKNMWLPKGTLIWCKEFDAANFTHHPRRCRSRIVF